jgi:hypothetical protein
LISYVNEPTTTGGTFCECNIAQNRPVETDLRS